MLYTSNFSLNNISAAAGYNVTGVKLIEQREPPHFFDTSVQQTKSIDLRNWEINSS